MKKRRPVGTFGSSRMFLLLLLLRFFSSNEQTWDQKGSALVHKFLAANINFSNSVSQRETGDERLSEESGKKERKKSSCLAAVCLHFVWGETSSNTWKEPGAERAVVSGLRAITSCAVEAQCPLFCKTHVTTFASSSFLKKIPKYTVLAIWPSWCRKAWVIDDTPNQALVWSPEISSKHMDRQIKHQEAWKHRIFAGGCKYRAK